MIILNIDLGKELEDKFYDKIRDKKLNYLEYVEQLIKEDLIPSEEQNKVLNNSKDGMKKPTFT